MNKQSRKWQITINNPADKGITHESLKQAISTLKSIVYYCLADEIGLGKETPHTHLFLAAKNGIRFSTIKNMFPEAHLESAHGTSAENREYIQKTGKWQNDPKADTSIDGTFEEWGELPAEKQGERTDLADLYDMLKCGMSNFEILEENPDHILNLDKLERVRQTIREEEYKTTFRNLEVTYIWGATNTGKTRSVMEKYGYDNVFRATSYLHGGFDTYHGQDIIIFEEFRSSLKIQEMLCYLDGYPVELPCRYVNKVACFTKVFLISNIDLTDQYRNIQHESVATWEAFLRRIQKVIFYTGVNEFTEYTTQEYLSTSWTRQPIAGNWEPPPPLPTDPPPAYKQTKLS